MKTASNDFLMRLQPNDLRAANYRAEAVEDDGKTYVLPPAAVNTLESPVLIVTDVGLIVGGAFT